MKEIETLHVSHRQSRARILRAVESSDSEFWNAWLEALAEEARADLWLREQEAQRLELSGTEAQG